MDPVTAYAKRVVTGRIVAGRLQRLACERHLDDLKRSKKRGSSFRYVFDVEKAKKPVDFCSRLRHTKGRWAGKPFDFAPWQLFLTGVAFGWVDRETGVRRFQVVYVEVGKKNGKTFWSACIGIYLAFFDREASAEVYSAATSAKQAKNVWDQARAIVQTTPALMKRIDVFRGSQNTLSARPPRFDKFEMLASDYGRRDGLFPSGGIIDELHEHKSRGIWDIVEKSSIGREQPMVISTTTAGHDRSSFCWKQRAYSVDVLEGHAEDDRWLAFIATIDEGDDWRDPKVWLKSNPSLGIAFDEETLRAKFVKAASDPDEENAFRRYHMNEWTEQRVRWMAAETWEECSKKKRRELESLSGELAFIGVQLAIVRDISAVVLVVEKGGALDVFPWFGCRERDVEERTRKDKRPYRQWVYDGDLFETSGDMVDHYEIGKFIENIVPRHGLVLGGVFFNRQNGQHLATRLVREWGLEENRVIGITPGYPALSEATNHLEGLFKSKRIRHADNPILRRMFQHVAVKRQNEDPDTGESEMMIDVARSGEKVCGMQALVYAVYGLLKYEQADDDEELKPVGTMPIGWG